MKTFSSFTAKCCLLMAVLTLGMTALEAPAFAADYPDRPVKVILGFGTGGPTDVIARTLAEQLTKQYNQRFIVDNVTGASGTIATETVAAAAADGYTLLVAATPLAVNESIFPNRKAKYGSDIVAVAPIGANSNVLVVPPSLNVHNLTEFTALARSKPKAVTYATVGLGSSSHLAGVAFDLRAGSTMLPVAYRGGGDALKDLLAGRINCWFAPIPAVLGAIKSGQLVPIATTGTERSPLLPAIPTMAESGFKDFNIRIWVGVFARKGVPEPIMNSLEQAIAHAMSSKEMQARFEHQGITPLKMSRAEFDKFVASEVTRWGTVVAAFKK